MKDEVAKKTNKKSSEKERRRKVFHVRALQIKEMKGKQCEGRKSKIEMKVKGTEFVFYFV